MATEGFLSWDVSSSPWNIVLGDDWWPDLKVVFRVRVNISFLFAARKMQRLDNESWGKIQCSLYDSVWNKKKFI